MLIREIPFYTIFIFILIISANFLAQLFPCRFQHALLNNMYVKHIFGLLTINFFVILTLPEYNNSLYETFTSSSLLYLLFIIVTNIDTLIFYIVIFLFGISYLIYLNSNVITNTLNAKNVEKVPSPYVSPESTLQSNDSTIAKLTDDLNFYNTVSYYVNIVSMVLIGFGFVVYLGKKKFEYKNKFNYLTFLFGRPACLNDSPDISYMTAIKYAFN